MKFSKCVLQTVKQIPKSKVVSYGQIAAHIGNPRGARAVGWILRQNEMVDIPWWRVVNNAGRISIKGNIFHNAAMQRDLLRQEGIVVNEDFTLDIERYRFFYV